MRDDINLLPKKQSTTSGQTIFVIILLSSVFILSVAYVGVLLPNLKISSINNSIKIQQGELREYKNIEKEYNNLLAEVANAQGLKTKNLLMTQLFKDLQDNMPPVIKFTSLTYTKKEMSIVGSSPDMVSIAQFMVNLRKLQYVKMASFTSADINNQANPGQPSGVYNFTISVQFISEDDQGESAEQPTVTEVPAQEGVQ